MKKNAVILAIDGIDGSGKSTQVELLKTYLTNKNFKVAVLQHSGGSEIGKKLREVSRSKTKRPAETDFYLSLAMAYALAANVESLAKENDFVIIDRSQLSMYAYNISAGKAVSKKEGKKALIIMSKLYQLDRIFHLKIDQDTANKRLKKRALEKDYFESKDKKFKEDILKGYKEGVEVIRKAFGDGYVRTIDANSPETEVHNKIVKIVKKML